MNRGDRGGRGGREGAAADAAGNMYGECAQAELKSPHESNLGPAAETSSVKVTLSERKSSSKCCSRTAFEGPKGRAKASESHAAAGELRECGEGVSSRYKPEMRRMEHAQGSVVRTDEADDET